MIIPDMTTLYEPYTKDGGTLDGAIGWLKKNTGSDDAVIQSVVAETFIELAGGKDFLSPCPCGCEMTNAHTHIEHYMGKKCLALKKEAEQAHSAVIQKNIQAMMLAHIQKQNDQFIAENTKPAWWRNWGKSETLNLFKKLRGKK